MVWCPQIKMKIFLMTLKNQIWHSSPKRETRWENRHFILQWSILQKFVPRALMVDLEPTVVESIKGCRDRFFDLLDMKWTISYGVEDIDLVWIDLKVILSKTGRYKDLFDKDNLIYGKESAAYNYARGHYTIGGEIINPVLDTLRILSENCSSLQGFMITHSFGGGTGSGFTSLLMERLSVDYGRKSKQAILKCFLHFELLNCSLLDHWCKFQFAISASPQIANSVVEPYNNVLHTHCVMEHTDCCFMFDNEALYGISNRFLGVEKPNYESINRLIAQVISSTTASLRFKGDLDVDLDEVRNNLVPYPRIHFPIISYAPFHAKDKIQDKMNTLDEFAGACFNSNNFMASIEPRHGKYMSCFLLARGDVASSEVNMAIKYIKKNSWG